MNSQKAQISMEYILLIGIVLVFLLPISYYAFSTSTQNMKMNQANEFVTRIAETADMLYALGPGSQETIQVVVPGGVEDITLQDNEVSLRIKIFGGVSDVSAITKAQVTGSITSEAGSYHILLKMLDNGTVEIRSQV